MSVAIDLSATTTTDRKNLRTILAAYAGETVTFTDRSGFAQSGVLSVGEWRDATEYGAEGFTVNVTDQAAMSFVGTGVWGDDACGNIPSQARIVVG